MVETKWRYGEKKSKLFTPTILSLYKSEKYPPPAAGVAAGKNTININNLQGLADGMYILQLTDRNGAVSKSQKIVKQ